MSSLITTPIPIIAAENLHKTYALEARAIEVLRGITLQIPEGLSTAITGISGAGKSTLLHVLAGLDRPDQGTVQFRGKNLYAMRARERETIRANQIGFVFQSYHLLPELTVLENVILPALANPGAWLRGAEIRKKAHTLLDQVGLTGRDTHRPSELSGGEQQRAAIARSLINNPALLFADEPTGNLDSQTGEKVLETLFGLVQARGLTLVMVTHNESIAARCARHIALADGRLTPP